jgi:hypothetical protein
MGSTTGVAFLASAIEVSTSSTRALAIASDDPYRRTTSSIAVARTSPAVT